MAKIIQSLTHSVSEIEKMTISIPENVTRNNLRCDESGDVIAKKIFESKGNYSKLSSSFNKIANICEKALNNSAFVSAGTKKELVGANKKCSAQAISCTKRMNEMKTSYNLTADIFSSLNK